MTRHPYPGLRAFTRDESDLFFGREGCVDEMVDRLGQERFLAVLGPSGGGKSSLVRTGLFDALDLGFLQSAGTDWLIIDMHPAGQPMCQLATALLSSVSSTRPSSEAINAMAKKLRQGPRSVAKWAADGNVQPGTNILLLVDQFEELFRYANYSQREEADAFVALLLESAATKLHPIYVVITMRSEYLGACSSIEQLAEHISKGLYLTPRMERAACREAIEGPAGVMGFLLEPALVNRMLNDLATFTPRPEENANDLGTQLALQADQLPLMQHVLNRLWLLAESAPHEGLAVLTLDAYKSLGGMSGAIDAHGKEIVARLTPGAQQALEPIFRALVAGNSVATATRQPTKIRELVALAGGNREDVIEVIEAFRSRDCNFLRTSTTALNDDTIVDISHESLIRQWTPLREWLEKEARDGAAWRRLLSAEERYTAGDEGLLTGLGFRSAAAWWASVHPNPVWAARHGGNFEKVQSFFEASRQAQEAHLEAERLRQGRERTFLIAGVIALAAIVLVVSWVGYDARKDARKAKAASLAAEAATLRADKNLADLQASERQLTIEKSTADGLLQQKSSLFDSLQEKFRELDEVRKRLVSTLGQRDDALQKATLAQQNAETDARRLVVAFDNINRIVANNGLMLGETELRADLLDEISKDEADIERQHKGIFEDASVIRNEENIAGELGSKGDVTHYLEHLRKGYEAGLNVLKFPPDSKDPPSQRLIVDFLEDAYSYDSSLFDTGNTAEGNKVFGVIENTRDLAKESYPENKRSRSLLHVFSFVENLESRHDTDRANESSGDQRKNYLALAEQHIRASKDLAIAARALQRDPAWEGTDFDYTFYEERALFNVVNRTSLADGAEMLSKGCELADSLRTMRPLAINSIRGEIDCHTYRAAQARKNNDNDTATQEYQNAAESATKALQSEPNDQRFLLAMAAVENARADLSTIDSLSAMRLRRNAKDNFVKALANTTTDQTTYHGFRYTYNNLTQATFVEEKDSVTEEITDPVNAEIKYYSDIVKGALGRTPTDLADAKDIAYILGDAYRHIAAKLEGDADRAKEEEDDLSQSISYYNKSAVMQNMTFDYSIFRRYCGVYVSREALYARTNRPDLMLADVDKMKSACSPALDKYPWDFNLRNQFIEMQATAGTAFFGLKRYQDAIPYLEYASHWADKKSSILLARIYREGLAGPQDELRAKALEDLAAKQTTSTITLPVEYEGKTYHNQFVVRQWPDDYAFKGVDDQVRWWADQDVIVDPASSDKLRALAQQAKATNVSFPQLADATYNRHEEVAAKKEEPKDPLLEKEQAAYERAMDFGRQQKWKQADQAIDDLLNIDPKSLSLLSIASNLYHEQWYQFDRAFLINQRRVELGNTAATQDLAEAALSATHYDTCTSLTAAIANQTSEDRLKLIMTSLEVACLTGEGNHDAAMATGERLRYLIGPGFEKVDWNFSGTKYYVTHHLPFSDQGSTWAMLFDALNEGDRNKALRALTALGVPTRGQ